MMAAAPTPRRLASGRPRRDCWACNALRPVMRRYGACQECCWNVLPAPAPGTLLPLLTAATPSAASSAPARRHRVHLLGLSEHALPLPDRAARRAPRRIAEAPLRVEVLLTSGEHELHPAVAARQRLVCCHRFLTSSRRLDPGWSARSFRTAPGEQEKLVAALPAQHGSRTSSARATPVGVLRACMVCSPACRSPYGWRRRHPGTSLSAISPAGRIGESAPRKAPGSGLRRRYRAASTGPLTAAFC